MLRQIWIQPEFQRSPILERMKTLIQEFCAFAETVGLHIRPYRDSSLGHFDRLPEDAKEKSFQNFLTYYRICHLAQSQDVPVDDERNLLWWAVKELGLRPCSDLFDKVDNGDVIEIYNPEFIQIYRNFHFFQICSYSMEDIFSYEWRDLFERDPNITQLLANQAFDLFTKNIRETLVFRDVGEHELIEKFSEGRHVMSVLHKYLSPLFDQKTGRISAFVVLSQARVIGSLKEADQPKISGEKEITKEILF